MPLPFEPPPPPRYESPRACEMCGYFPAGIGECKACGADSRFNPNAAENWPELRRIAKALETIANVLVNWPGNE